jgi:hypothetical protein
MTTFKEWLNLKEYELRALQQRGRTLDVPPGLGHYIAQQTNNPLVGKIGQSVARGTDYAASAWDTSYRKVLEKSGGKMPYFGLTDNGDIINHKDYEIIRIKVQKQSHVGSERIYREKQKKIAIDMAIKDATIQRQINQGVLDMDRIKVVAAYEGPDNTEIYDIRIEKIDPNVRVVQAQ